MSVIILTGLDPTKIINALQSINENYEDVKKRFVSNPFGNGQASKKLLLFLKNTIAIFSKVQFNKIFTT